MKKIAMYTCLQAPVCAILGTILCLILKRSGCIIVILWLCLEKRRNDDEKCVCLSFAYDDEVTPPSGCTPSLASAPANV